MLLPAATTKEKNRKTRREKGKKKDREDRTPSPSISQGHGLGSEFDNSSTLCPALAPHRIVCGGGGVCGGMAGAGGYGGGRTAGIGILGAAQYGPQE